LNPKKLKPSPSEVIYLIEQMTKIINDGYSIIYARKIICGGNKSIKTQAVMKHPLYLHVLNQYMKDRCTIKPFIIISRV
jgi:hypothetical protein